jgi:hypothetical protein
MGQLGILFDAQKLGSGFYGYTAFRILFTALPVRELSGCILYHGEIGDGRNRPYCVAIETDHPGILPRIRQVMAASMARGLLPVNQRFLDEGDMHEEVLAMAARITEEGEMTETQSRWLQEAWQRAQGQTKLDSSGGGGAPDSMHHAQQAGMPPQRPGALRQTVEPRHPPRLPDTVPFVLRLSAGGRKAFAFLVAFSIGGAMLPWLGWGLALCGMLFTAGLLQGIVLRWRQHAEDRLSGNDVLQEAKKLLGSKPLHEVAEKLSNAVAQASPLLRRLHVSARATDLAGACLIVEQHERADKDALESDVLELRTHAWAVAASACTTLAALHVFQGVGAAGSEAPRLAFGGLLGCALLHMLANLVAVTGQRLQAGLRQRIGDQWLPLLSKAVPAPKTQFDSMEKALHELAGEFQALRLALERRRDSEFVDTISSLRSSIDQLTPVLAGFREPFILQAVPVNGRPKAMSATA